MGTGWAVDVVRTLGLEPPASHPSWDWSQGCPVRFSAPLATYLSLACLGQNTGTRLCFSLSLSFPPCTMGTGRGLDWIDDP